jgi:hypothetical protein
MASGHYLPFVGNTNIGQRTLYGTWLPPGSRVAAYVGPQSDATDAYSSSSLLVSTLNAGLARCRSGKGDTVVVLPGHTENVSTADFFTSLVAGTNIVGVAPFRSTLMPTFTFTATAATFLVDVANVTISGLKFAVGIDEVVNMLNVSGAGCSLINNYFQVGTASNMDSDTPLIVSSGATDCSIIGNHFIGTSTAINTNIIAVSGTAVDNFTIAHNFIHASVASSGLISLTGTATGFRIHENTLHNTSGTAPNGISHADTALVGTIHDNRFAFTTDITVLTGSIAAAGVATASVRSLNNFGCDEDSLGGVLTPVLTNLE